MIKSDPQKIIEWKKRSQRNMLKRYRRFKKLYQDILRRDYHKCQAVKDGRKCHSIYGAQIHHIKSRGQGGKDAKQNLITLCINCHNEYHRGTHKREMKEQFKKYIKTIYVKPKNQ